MPIPTAFATGALLLLALYRIAGAASYSFELFDIPQEKATFAFGINAGGDIACDAEREAYIGRVGAFAPVRVPGALLARVYGLNNRGDVVGFYNQGIDAATGRRKLGAFVLRNGRFELFTVPDSRATEANGINDAGAVVGTYATRDGIDFGFVYAAGAFSTLAVPGAAKTEAQGINDAGTVVGWAEIGGARRGFVATPNP